MSFRQHGCDVVPLTEIVDQLMIMQGNMNRSHYMATLLHARYAWKDLLRTTIFSMRNFVLPVCNDMVVVPDGVENVYALSYVDDCGLVVPLSYNPKINTLSLDVTESACACKVCNGDGTLCQMIDDIIYRTEEIDVNGQIMYKRIWNKTDNRGNMYEVTQTPVFDPDAQMIVYLESQNLICKLDVNKNGCVADTDQNRSMLYNHCGCYMLSACCDFARTPRYPTTPSDYGSWNYDKGSGSIIHLRGVHSKSLIITAQANDECEGGDQLVPEFAVDAIMFCIQYRQQAFAPANVIPAAAKEYSYRQYRRVKGDLLRYLYPIDMQAFAELGSIIPKW